MEKITIKQVYEIDPIFGKRIGLEVVTSTHRQHLPGSRFDYGYAAIVLAQGYTLEILPLISQGDNS